jgi:phosphorylcholine metabolism protein LicD
MDQIGNEFNKESGDKHFQRVTSILSSHKMPYWVDQGTLLGIIRDKEIIPWEWDLDFGVFENEVSRSMVEKVFLDKGFIKENISDGNNCMHFLFENERKVDITFYEKKDDYAITYFVGPDGIYGRFIKHAFSVLKNGKITTRNMSFFKKLLFNTLDYILLIPNVNKRTSKYFLSIIKKRIDNLKPISPRSYKIPLAYLEIQDSIMFLGTKISIPIEPVKYLEYSYGKTWNTPIRNYTWYKEKTPAYL